MSSNADLLPRQIWANPTPTSTSLPRHCTPFRLPSGGLLAIGDGSTVTLTQEAIFQPYCTSGPEFRINTSNLESIDTDHKDPFYASTLPQMYAIAAVTVVSYLLVIMLFITPRTFFVSGLGGGGGFLGQRGMISGASGSTSVIGVGGRPWLQKVAALTVAISLTIASVDTFQVAERQYAGDYSDAPALTNEVVNSVELRVVRVVSETFLWLAQAQTLIRLFPRHKEKVIIKWAGFVLIALDTIFNILNNFVGGSSRNAPRRFQDAVPALSYLFTFCLSLIYAAWIIYYSLSKRRYAFFHPKMRNICLVALLSYVAVLIPVVFFILDISIYDVAGWGNYVRWVGAAAASVVVWEWVERIEALERDERKDGILGREIFDGDEMLEITPSSAATWSGSRRSGGNGGNNQYPAFTDVKGAASIIHRINRRGQKSRRRPNQTSRLGSSHLTNEYLMTGAAHNASIQLSQPTSSSNLATPSNMLDSTTPGSPEPQRNLQSSPSSTSQQQPSDLSSTEKPDDPSPSEPQPERDGIRAVVTKTFWDAIQKIPIPFLNRHMSPPIEVKQAVRSSQQPGMTEPSQTPSEPPVSTTHSLLDRFGLKKTPSAPKPPLPVTIVPAPSRNITSWNDVRFHAGSPPLSRPIPQNALGHSVRFDTPFDQLSGQSTLAATSANDTHTPALTSPQISQPSQGSHGALPQAARSPDSANKEISNPPREDSQPLPGALITTNPTTAYGGQQAKPSSSNSAPEQPSSMPEASHEIGSGDLALDRNAEAESGKQAASSRRDVPHE
ncbi:MAG: hypothetical protein Q9225_004199 [Loekoesia sp. 1 TL-2023]